MYEQRTLDDHHFPSEQLGERYHQPYGQLLQRHSNTVHDLGDAGHVTVHTNSDGTSHTNNHSDIAVADITPSGPGDTFAKP